METALLAFRLCAFGVCLFTLQWTISLRLVPNFVLLFLFTAWTMVGNVVYFFIASLSSLLSLRHHQPQHISDSNNNNKRNSSLSTKLTQLSFLLRHGACLMSLTTLFVFWTIFFYDRELIHPKNIPVPPTLNHLQHSFPVLLHAIDSWLLSRSRGGGHKVGLLASSPTFSDAVFLSVALVISLKYSLLNLGLFLHSGRWIYPFVQPMLELIELQAGALWPWSFVMLCVFSMTLFALISFSIRLCDRVFIWYHRSEREKYS